MVMLDSPLSSMQKSQCDLG